MKLKENSQKNMRLLRRFMPYLLRHKKEIVLDWVCASLTTVCELALPLIVGQITDDAVNDVSTLTVQRIFGVAAFYIMLRIVDAVANYYMTCGGHVMGSRIETEMRNDLFGHLQGLSFSFFDNTKVGQLMSRLTSDLFDVTEFAHHFPEEILIAVIKVIGCFVIFARMNIWFTLIIFAMFPLVLIMTKRNRQKMRETFKDSRHQIGEINAITEDSLLGIRVVQSYGNEPIEKQKFDKGAQKFLKLKRASYKYMANFHTTVRLFDGLMYVIVLTGGALFLRVGQITAGNLSTYLLMVSTLMGTIRRIVEFSEQFSRGMTGIERFDEVISELSEIRDTENAKELETVKGEIAFKDVTFAYNGTDSNVLTNISFTAKAGESVAVVGPSGGGKTTLCNLIPRFYEVSNGEITIDGENIKDFTLRSLRSHIGVVQQDVYMFSGTVKENIAYGKPEATDEDIIAAAKNAGAHEFITGLPDGYDTYVGERGVKLSGGQKQRISIARVFLKDPEILILDEATSALDNESERLVQQSLERLAKGRTTVTIAHRLTTIRNASHILVLTEDGIAEQGSHNELIEKGGIYADMYAMYSV